MASVGNVKLNKPECGQCEKRHFGECRMNENACFRCGSHEHFIRDCPELDEKDKSQNVRSNNTTVRGKPPRNVGNVSAKAPAITYAIRAHKEASSPDVITGTFSLYDTDVVALIDPRSTHSYICVNLVSSKNLLVDSTKFVIKVSNPLGKHVLVDKVCNNCSLMTRGY
ncbi:Gag-Pol polyprotein [Gossypium australe]|uniref:Gag-Pol polyprotein n=1 Tax=Gossypium australe TaxID=47621 RepID=A0A5B6WEM8_9ROSI|nr:Gag-Pol polyprotein [Gossypium australe]